MGRIGQLQLTGLVMALALAISPGAALAQTSGSDHQSSSAHESPHRAPAVKQVIRSYGGKPVTPDTASQKMRISFQGKRGDRVLLTELTLGRDEDAALARRTSLSGPEGKVQRMKRPWWRLQASGWQTFKIKPGRYGTPIVRLTKVHMVKVKRNGKPRQLTNRLGHLSAVGFKVPPTGLLSASVVGYGKQVVVLPGHVRGQQTNDSLTVLGDDLPLARAESIEFGDPKTSAYFPHGKTVKAGDVVRIMAFGGIAVAAMSYRVPATIDGPAVPIDATDPRRATEVVINGTQGQLVRLNSSEVSKKAHIVDLFGSDGSFVPAAEVPGLWRLPVSGENRFLILPLPGRGVRSAPLQFTSE